MKITPTIQNKEYVTDADRIQKMLSYLRDDINILKVNVCNKLNCVIQPVEEVSLEQSVIEKHNYAPLFLEYKQYIDDMYYDIKMISAIIQEAQLPIIK